MFYGRKRELDSLERLYKKSGFQMTVVYGRRRIGKTYLLNEFIKDKNSIYFPAEELNDTLNLKKFSGILGEKIGIKKFPTVESWENLFMIIKEYAKDEKLVVVIDEYPYAANANASLGSILQHLIDYELRTTNIFLILCGSSMSFMEDNVLGEKSPLFGRRTSQLKINPLDYFDSSLFYPDASCEDKIKYYACVGGTPYYLSLIDPNLSFEENMKDLYFQISGYLLNEGVLLMKQEFREPLNYNSILQAIASGCDTLSEIVGFTKLDSNKVSKYIVTLRELNYIERIIPFNSNPLKSKVSKYKISENFIAFWYRYIFSAKTEIENGSEDVYFNVMINDLPNFIGSIFEDITIQYLRRKNKDGNLDFIAKSFGKWWGKDRKGNVQEIDVIVESILDKKLLIGECKWRNSFDLKKTFNKLNERAEIFSEYETYKYIFTKNKISEESKKKFDLKDNVVNVCIEEYFR